MIKADLISSLSKPIESVSNDLVALAAPEALDPPVMGRIS